MKQIKQSAYEIFGITLEQVDSDIKTRYIELIKEHSPEKDPEKFMQIRQAYETIVNPDVTDMQLYIYRCPLEGIPDLSPEKEINPASKKILREVFEVPFDVFSELKRFLKPMSFKNEQ